MRTSLLPGLVEILQEQPRRQQERVRLFEIGLHLRMPAARRIETPRIAARRLRAARSRECVGEAIAHRRFLRSEGRCRSPVRAWPAEHARIRIRRRRTARGCIPAGAREVVVDGKSVGFVGGLHPRLLKALDLDDDV